MLKILNIIWSIIRWIITVILVVLLAIVVTQRITSNRMSILGLRIFTVITESMVPKYNVGDAIFTIAVKPEDIKIGDDITYIGSQDSFKDKIVTHAVIDIEKDENGMYIFQTKGIANDEADPKINQTQIYGKVLYKIKTISYLNGVIGNLYGMYFAIFVPMGVIMFIEFVAYQKDKEKDDDEEDIEENELTKKAKRKAKRNKRRKRKQNKA